MGFMQRQGSASSMSIMRRIMLITLLLAAALFATFFYFVRKSAENFGYKQDLSNYGCDLPTRRGDLLVEVDLHVDTAEGWRVRRLNHLDQSNNQMHFGPDPGDHGSNWGGNRSFGPVFFQDNWEPSFSCEHEKRIGHWGDGGKWICNPERIPRPAVVYSLGSNNEFSFEMAMHEYFDGNVEIHTFDAGNAPSKPPYVTYHQHFIGVDAVKNNITYKSVNTILKELNHFRIDVFKIDIEGHEMEALLPLLENGLWSQNIKQIQIEIHLVPGRFPVTPSQTDRFFTLLSSKYQMEIFHKEPNIKFGGGAATEFSLVQVDWKRAMELSGFEC